VHAISGGKTDGYRWLAGDGIRAIARATGLDRKTIRPFLKAATDLGLKPGSPWPDEATVSPLQSKPSAHDLGHHQVRLRQCYSLAENRSSTG
jgi:transposase